jgi:hypothetical protein
VAAPAAHTAARDAEEPRRLRATIGSTAFVLIGAALATELVIKLNAAAAAASDLVKVE